MSRTAVSTRSSVSSRDHLHPQTYLVDLYGDSFSDPTTGYICYTLGGYTSENYDLNEYGVGGENLADIKVRFDAAFPDTTRNMIVLQGSINNIANAGKQTTLAQMKSDMGAMADAVIADGRYYLAVVGLAPWMGHANWTATLQTQTTDYNAWLAATYPEYYVNIYDALGDPAEPRQLADEFYKLDRTNLHPNKNADRVIDRLIGELLYQRNTTTLTEPSGNLIANYRDFSGWTLTAAALGGNSIVLADGTTGTANGLLPTGNVASIKMMQANTSSSPANNAALEMVAYLHPGEQDWAWMQYRDSAGGTYQIYLDLVNVALGSTGGTGGATPTWSIEKSTYGWLKVTLNVTNSATGSTLNNINIRSAASGTVIDTDSYDRTTDGYPVEIFVDAVSVTAA